MLICSSPCLKILQSSVNTKRLSFAEYSPRNKFLFEIFALKSWFYRSEKQETNALYYPYTHFKVIFMRLTFKQVCQLPIRWFCSIWKKQLKPKITSIFASPMCFMNRSQATRKLHFVNQLPVLNRSGRSGHKSQQLFPSAWMKNIIFSI